MLPCGGCRANTPAALPQRFSVPEDLAQANEDYEQAAAESAGRRPLTDQEAAEVKQIFRRLVKVYHPDRFTGDPDKQSTYERLTTAINRARDDGDLDALREIAADPEGFILRQGWSSVSLDDSEEADRLQELYASLQGEILGVLESLEALRHSPEYELHERVVDDPNAFERAVEAQSRAIARQISELDAELERLDEEVAALE